MDANEIIEYAQKSLKDTERFINSIAPYGYGVGGYSKEDDFWRSIIRELSRSRIRVTAEEKPTREDADKWSNVIAYDRAICYGNRNVEGVVENPELYPFWSQIPQLPEVTP